MRMTLDSREQQQHLALTLEQPPVMLALPRAAHAHVELLPLDGVPPVGQHAVPCKEDLAVGPLAQHRAELQVRHLHTVV